jgi:cAMP-dependent protein kinase regulator
MAKPTADLEPQLRAHRDRALSYVAAGKLKPALEEYRKMLALQPGDVAVRQRVAELAARLGRTAEALADYEAVVDGYAAQGFLIKAIAICKVMVQLDPTQTAAQEKLAAFYAKDRAARGIPEPAPKAAAAGAAPEATASPLDPERLPQTPLFSELPRDALTAVVASLRLRSVAAGATVVTEGERGDAMYVVVSGKVEVWRHDPAAAAGASRTPITTLEEGAFFGEMALVSNAARFASVTAVEETQLLELDRATVDKLAERYPSLAHVIDRFYKQRLLANLLAANPVFRPLPPARKEEVVAAFAVRTVAPDTTLCAQGQPGTGLFVILRGRCRVSYVEPAGSEVTYPELTEGDLFGELSLLGHRPATATVRAATPCVLLHMPADEVHRLVLSDQQASAAIKQIGGERLSRTFEALRPFGIAALRPFLV